MLFSILIANYNNGRFFKECYQSILQQTYSNWEVIIVDDGSTDDSVAVIKNTIQDDPRFKLYINEENKGCGYTKRRCAALAKGEIMGFLDPDDTLVNKSLQSMVEAHKKFPLAAIVTSNYQLVDVNLQTIKKGHHAGNLPPGTSFLTQGKGKLTHFASFKKKPYKASGGLDPKMKRAVDQDLYYKMEEQGGHIFINEILYQYRIHNNNISRNDNLYKAKYWHFYAITKASRRRRAQKMEIDNYTVAELNRIASSYYLERLEGIKNKLKFFRKLYWLYKAILSDPFHKTTLKFKLFILILIGKI